MKKLFFLFFILVLVVSVCAAKVVVAPKKAIATWVIIEAVLPTTVVQNCLEIFPLPIIQNNIVLNIGAASGKKVIKNDGDLDDTKDDPHLCTAAIAMHSEYSFLMESNKAKGLSKDDDAFNTTNILISSTQGAIIIDAVKKEVQLE